MNTFNIDGKKIDEENYLKDIFDLPVFDGDFEYIYEYLCGFYTKTVINLTNSDLIDSELKIAFERAANDNQFVSVNVEN